MDAKWFSFSDFPGVVFDHSKIIDLAIQRLRNKIVYEPIRFELLPAEFTLNNLPQLYEIILGEELDKRNFIKMVLKSSN